MTLQGLGTMRDAAKRPVLKEGSTTPGDLECIPSEDKKLGEVSPMLSPDPVASMKRIFLQLRSTTEPIDEIEIVNKFLALYGSGINGDNKRFVHCQPQDLKYFYIIIDMNYTQASNPVLQALPHEVYNVRNEKDKL